jgi:hypothetical protein
MANPEVSAGADPFGAVTTCHLRDRASPLLRMGEELAGLHAEETSKVSLHLDAGRQRAPPYGHLGDLVGGVEQDEVAPLPTVFLTCSRKCAAWCVSPLRTSS